jgi:hypothetical protein
MAKSEQFPRKYIPNNATIIKNFEKYYDKLQPDCPELDTNEIRRIFNKYDKCNLGLINKNQIQFLFFDIKNILERNQNISEKKFIDNMLDFYSKTGDSTSVSDIKKCFSKILSDNKSNNVIFLINFR